VFAFAEAGAEGIICADIQGDQAARVAQESIALATFPNFRSLGFALDITDSQSVNSLVEFTVKEFGRIDFLVNAAGVSTQRHLQVRGGIAYGTCTDRCRSPCTVPCHF
jgi:NAD(P)-dependent dehydrogenase (short-subunit alcohol dehydrogenase family)